MPKPRSGPSLILAAPGSPVASGYSANLPPHQWASAPAGSTGVKKILIYLTALLFALLGMSPDIPLARCTQLHCGTMGIAAILGLHPALRVAPSIRTDSKRRCSVGPLRTTQWWHPRSWRKYGRRARLKPGCPVRACRFNSCRAHFVVSSVRDGIGRRAGFRLRCP